MLVTLWGQRLKILYIYIYIYIYMYIYIYTHIYIYIYIYIYTYVCPDGGKKKRLYHIVSLFFLPSQHTSRSTSTYRALQNGKINTQTSSINIYIYIYIYIYMHTY